MKRLLMVSLLLVGCGRSAPDPPPHPDRKVTWEEYQAMDAEQKDDPYVTDNLDAHAQQKRAESLRKRPR